jgi:hypothetical protein
MGGFPGGGFPAGGYGGGGALSFAPIMDSPAKMSVFAPAPYGGFGGYQPPPGNPGFGGAQVHCLVYPHSPLVQALTPKYPATAAPHQASSLPTKVAGMAGTRHCTALESVRTNNTGLVNSHPLYNKIVSVYPCRSLSVGLLPARLFLIAQHIFCTCKELLVYMRICLNTGWQSMRFSISGVDGTRRPSVYTSIILFISKYHA